MTPGLWQRLKPLYEQAQARPAELREAFVDEVSAGDEELGQELRKLLLSDQQATGPLGVPADLSTTLSAVFSPFRSGELILERFRIVRPLDAGGMGEVYEAEDLLLGPVALKTVRADIANSPDALHRLRQEVQLARRVSGSQVCRIHEFFAVPARGPQPATAFISMELLDGVTLARHLAATGPLPSKQALAVALDICEGLRLIHAQGIIHRDLKAANIMLCRDGETIRTVLMDFGLAYALPAKAAKLTAAAQGSDSTFSYVGEAASLPGISGTPANMAPEQFEGQPSSPATDLYAFGIVLYEMVTGVQPYAGDTPFAAAVRRARHRLPASTLQRGIPRHWDRVIDCCLQFEPVQRYQSAAAVADALRASPLTIENLRHDRKWILQAAAVLLLCLGAWLGFRWWQSSQIFAPSAQAARDYADGVASLRRGTYIKATQQLNKAIDEDPPFPQAHVRLAEAWSALDFQANAQQELLLASDGERRLGPLDRMYLQAIRSEVTGNFPAAVSGYRAILDKLPPSDRSAGYVDLGFARERGGEPAQAIEDYTRAEALDPDNAAAFLHAAVLHARLNHKPEAQQAFDRTETLYRTEINQEGLAVLHYERGYDANVRRDPRAKEFLELSLHEAQEIPSVQLQIRSLAQLSSATNRFNSDEAAHYAERAINLARQNRLDAFAAIALVRLSAAQLRQGRHQQSRDSLNEGLAIAEQTQQRSVQAFANSQLANLENQEHHPDRVIGPAQAALAYYQKNGYFDSAARLSVLIIRTQRDREEYGPALQSAQQLYALAAQSGQRELLFSAEELLGSINLKMERFPDALPHFLNARQLADAESNQQNERLLIAHTLWCLGRFAEAEKVLDFTPVDSVTAVVLALEHLGSLLAQIKFGAGLALIQTMPQKFPELEAGERLELLQRQVLTEAHLHRGPEARRDLLKLQDASANEGPSTRATIDLTAGEVYVALGQPSDLAQQAFDDAARAARHFHAVGQMDSELRSVCAAAAAARATGNASAFADFNQRAVDILAVIGHTWSLQDAQSYLSRPDRQNLLFKPATSPRSMRTHG